MRLSLRIIFQQIKNHLKNESNERINNNIFSWDTNNSTAKIRLVFIALCFMLCFLVIAYRLILMASNEYPKPGRAFSKSEGFRKEIVDRYGNLLAVNVPSSSLFANPQKIIDPKACLNKLAQIISIDVKKLHQELLSSKSFVWIKRDLTPREQSEIFNLGLPGFDFEKEQKRVYTFGNLLSHVIGYVGRDFTGLAGLEKSYDDFLTNKQLTLTKEEYNKPLQLTIDIRLQNILNEEIEKTLKEFSAVSAMGVIVDPNNGEVLAMISKPDFDPHHPNLATSEQLFNNSSLGVFEMGSGFKGITLAIAYDTDTITSHDAYDISYMKIGKFQLKDYHPRQGWHTVPEIFLHSSNIGTGQIALEVGKANFKKYLKALGLLDQLQIELPERGSPLFQPDSRWDDLSLVTMSYGYALSISPLHFAQAMIPIVNGGNFHPLTLIKRDETKPLISTRIFKETTSKEMRKLMRLTVTQGNGKKADVKGYLVGGKTGTAELAVNGKYVKNKRRSSFFGILPASNPKYAIYITFNEPKGTKESFGFATAGWTAAPAVSRILERMVALYGLEGAKEDDADVQEMLNIEYKIDDEV